VTYPLSAAVVDETEGSTPCAHGLRTGRSDHCIDRAANSFGRPAVVVDPTAATVTVAFRARMPFALAGEAGGISITAEATATAPLD
jgi:hypothetical protein